MTVFSWNNKSLVPFFLFTFTKISMMLLTMSTQDPNHWLFIILVKTKKMSTKSKTTHLQVHSSLMMQLFKCWTVICHLEVLEQAVLGDIMGMQAFRILAMQKVFAERRPLMVWFWRIVFHHTQILQRKWWHFCWR